MTTLLVASGGGHLQQLAALVPRLGLTGQLVWATPQSGLAEHLLREETHIVLPHTHPRDWRGALRLAGPATRILKHHGIRRVISTGASPAPPLFLAAASMGLEMHYIESATRSEGPSLSGRLVSTIRSASLYSQYPSWAQGRWHFAGSIFDPFTPEPTAHPEPIRRVVVTLGTETYGFRRALERVDDVRKLDSCDGEK